MKNDLKPAHMVAFGLFVMSLGGFLTVVHIGTQARQPKGFSYGFGSRTAEVQKPAPAKDAGLAEDFRKGGEVLADKAGDLFGDIFGGESRAPAGAPTASARSGSGGGEEAGSDESDPFEDFYKKNYGRNSGSSSSSGSGGSWGGFSGSWGGSGGSSTSGDFGGGGDGQAPAKAAAKGASAEEEPDGRAPRAGRPSVEDGSGEWVKLPRGGRGRHEGAGAQLASLPGGGQPMQGLERPGDLSGGQLAPGKGPGGSLSGMPGDKKGSVDLNGADETSRGGATSKFDAKTSGGGSAISAAGAAAGGAGGGGGGGGVPAASAAKEVSPDGKDGDKKGGDKKDVASSSSAASGKGIWGWFRPASEDGGEMYASARTAPKKTRAPAAPEDEFLKTVVNERMKGAEADYVAEVDKDAEPDTAHLKSGTVVSENKMRVMSQDGEEEEKPDPEKFSKLSPERKKELRKEVHVFLKKVENKYGAMTDLFYTPCAKAKEICADNALTEGYLTMHTRDGARLLLGLKYSDKKWAPYTVSFGTTARPTQPAGEQPAVEPGAEDPSGDDTQQLSDDGAEG